LFAAGWFKVGKLVYAAATLASYNAAVDLGGLKMIRIFIFLLCCLALSFAQQRPELSLNAFEFEAGESLELRSSGLDPTTTYDLKLTSPSGTVLQEALSSSSAGELAFTSVLTEAGTYRLELSGQGLGVSFDLEVSPASETATETAPPETTEPAEAAAEAETETTPARPEAGAVTPAETSPAEPDQASSLSEEPLAETDPASPEASQETAETNEAQPQAPTQTAEASPATEAAEATPESNPTETEDLAQTPAAEPGSSSPAGETETQAVQVPAEIPLSFPANSGDSIEPVRFAAKLFQGHGNSVLELDPASGQVLARHLVSGQVRGLEPSGDALVISTELSNGLSETFTLLDGKVQEPVRFDANPAIFDWLKNEAELANPATRLTQDTTNPWLYLKAAQSASDPAEARAAYEAALEKAQTFYDFAGISRVLLEAQQTDLADQAFDAALRDFAARGYDPRLLSNLELHENYHFPLRPLQAALASGKREEAAFWAKWLRYFVTPQVPETRQALGDYANLLRQSGERAEATIWREAANAGRRSGVGNLLESFFSALGGAGWYSVLALLIAIIALHLTLTLKYWTPQTAMLKRRQAAKAATSPLSRLFAIRYYSFTEKLVLVLMFAAVLLLVGLAAWRNQPPVKAGGSGTLASTSAQAALVEANLQEPRANFIRAYAAQAAGKLDEARRLYQAAGNFAPALNNLAALDQDETLYNQALKLAPGLLEARYNLGEQLSQFPFQQDYRPGEAILAIPASEDFQAAVSGSWSEAIVRTFSKPWAVLQAARPAVLHPLLWIAIIVIFFIWALLSLLWLFIPRPRLARNAPRSLLYHPLSLLIPGSGLADEMWGVLLLIPWALVGLDALSELFGWGFGIGLNLRWDYLILMVIYGINLVAVIIEFFSYNRRMRQLRQKDPELAREFRLLR
jgi:hypothetical protein